MCMIKAKNMGGRKKEIFFSMQIVHNAASRSAFINVYENQVIKYYKNDFFFSED